MERTITEKHAYQQIVLALWLFSFHISLFTQASSPNELEDLHVESDILAWSEKLNSEVQLLPSPKTQKVSSFASKKSGKDQIIHLLWYKSFC